MKLLIQMLEMLELTEPVVEKVVMVIKASLLNKTCWDTIGN